MNDSTQRIHNRNHNRRSRRHAAIDGETFEVNEMVPADDAVVKLRGEKGAESSIHFASDAEKIHAAMYQKAKQAVEALPFEGERR